MSIVACLVAAALMVGPTERPASDPPREDLLAGPGVESKPAAPTLVRHTFDGDLIEVEEEPHLAAIRLLELTDEQRAALEKALNERLLTFDQALRANYGLIAELTGIQQKPMAERIALLGKVTQAFKPFIDRGTMLDEMRDLLTSEQRTEVERLVVEYAEAKLADMRRELMNPDAPRPQLLTRWRLESFGQMIRQSIERQVGLRREAFEQLLARLSLSPEQDSKVRAIVQDIAVKELEGKVSAADRTRVFMQVRALLTPEQQKQLWEYVLEQYRGG